MNIFQKLINKIFKKLTKEKALESCQKHWQYIADHDPTTKGFYFLKHKDLDIPYMQCYCCEYSLDTQYSIVDCEKCPLDGYAWHSTQHRLIEDKIELVQYGCEHDENSSYKLWKKAVDVDDLDTCEQYALEIVTHCKNALKDLRVRK